MIGNLKAVTFPNRTLQEASLVTGYPGKAYSKLSLKRKVGLGESVQIVAWA